MSTPLVLQFPQFLEDQNLWLSLAAWALLLRWLWPRVSRTHLLVWVAVACALHLGPLLEQAMRFGADVSLFADEKPAAFWAMQVFNVAVLALIVRVWRRTGETAQRERTAQAVAAERRRIASDLHDGVGSRLTALLASQDPHSANDPGSLSMALQACLLELHMTVDDLDDQSSATIVERLGHLRYRLQPAFDRMGVKLIWNVNAVAQNYPLPPEAAMQVCRIAQEALSNTLRHSRASCVELRFGPISQKRGLKLEVRDNGHGLIASRGVSCESLGKGLRSMRNRAESLNAELAVMDTQPHGLCIRLIVPCEQEQSHRRSVPELARTL